MQEIWKALPGYEGIYEVSSIGRVKTIGRYLPIKTVTAPNGRWQPEVMRKAHINKFGYNHIRLTNNYVCKYAAVHRLVAMAFLPRIKGKNVVNHINGNRSDNRVENLEWCTQLENIQHGVRNRKYGEHKTPNGKRLTPDEVLNIRGLSGVLKATEIATMFDIKEYTVYRIANRKVYNYI